MNGLLDQIFNPVYTYTVSGGIQTRMDSSLNGNVYIGDSSTNYGIYLNGAAWTASAGVANICGAAGSINLSGGSGITITQPTAGTFVFSGGASAGVTSICGAAGSINLSSGSGITIAQPTAGTFVFTGTGGTNAGVSAIAVGGVSLSGVVTLSGTPGITTTNVGNTIVLSNTGVTTVCGAAGSINLSGGNGITIAQPTAGTFVFTGTGGTNAGVSAIAVGAVSLSGVVTLSGTPGITATNVGNTVVLSNTGVTTVCGAAGSINLSGGSGITIAQPTAGTFVFTGTGGTNAGVSAIAVGAVSLSGVVTLSGTPGITATNVGNTVVLSNTGVTTVCGAAGSINLSGGSGITIAQPNPGTFVFTGTGGGGVTSISAAGTAYSGIVGITAGTDISITSNASGFTIANTGSASGWSSNPALTDVNMNQHGISNCVYISTNPAAYGGVFLQGIDTNTDTIGLKLSNSLFQITSQSAGSALTAPITINISTGTVIIPSIQLGSVTANSLTLTNNLQVATSLALGGVTDTYETHPTVTTGQTFNLPIPVPQKIEVTMYGSATNPDTNNNVWVYYGIIMVGSANNPGGSLWHTVNTLINTPMITVTNPTGFGSSADVVTFNIAATSTGSMNMNIIVKRTYI